MHSKFANSKMWMNPLAFSFYAALNTGEKVEKTIIEIEKHIFIFGKKRAGNSVNVIYQIPYFYICKV
jgi:hypothetical protein